MRHIGISHLKKKFYFYFKAKSSRNNSRRSSVCSIDSTNSQIKSSNKKKVKSFAKKEVQTNTMNSQINKPTNNNNNAQKLETPVSTKNESTVKTNHQKAISTSVKTSSLSNLNSNKISPSPVAAATATAKNENQLNWELHAHCIKCNKKITIAYKCIQHGDLNKTKDIRYYSNFTDRADKNLKPIRKYPNTFSNYYSACKKVAKGTCDKDTCVYAHNDLERKIWNYMLEKKIKNLYEIIEPQLTPAVSVATSKLMVVGTNGIDFKSNITEIVKKINVDDVELPENRFDYKKFLSNYCRICNLPFENKNAYLNHRLQDKHLKLQKLARQFQFLCRMPPDLCKLEKVNLCMCPALLNEGKCKDVNNTCSYPHHIIEVQLWSQWYDYYNKQKDSFNNNNMLLSNNESLSICEYQVVDQMPKLKKAISYYINETYLRPWHLVQTKNINELNYNALMHGMIYNEMISCIKLVENTNWNCYVEAHDLNQRLFKINLLATLNGNEHRFYKDLRLIEYINIIRVELLKDCNNNDQNENKVDFLIKEKYFADSLFNETYKIYVIVEVKNEKYFNMMKNLCITANQNANSFKCTLMIDRSMFYVMHYAVDNANKSILFPPRLDCANTNIEESLNVFDGDYKFVKEITNEQKQVILRILKEKSGVLAPPVSKCTIYN